MTEPMIYQDRDAGVSFPVPFEQPLIKTSAQVTGLVLEGLKGQIPEGAHLTSGIYSRAGTPYILVWSRPDKSPPTQADVESLAKMMTFDRALLKGVMREPLPARDGLKTLIVTQIAKGETIQLAYYYKSQPDASAFQVIADGFTLQPDKRLDPDVLPSGPSNTVVIVIGLLAFVVGFSAVLISRRVYLKRALARPSRGHGNA